MRIVLLIIWLEQIERPKCELIIGLYKMLNYLLPRCSCEVHLLILSSRWQSKHFPGQQYEERFMDIWRNFSSQQHTAFTHKRTTTKEMHTEMTT